MSPQSRQRREAFEQARNSLQIIAESVQKERTKILGMSIDTWAIILTALLAVSGFYFRTNSSLEKITESNMRVSTAVELLADFAQSSDAYHSAVTGLEFKNGRPLNGINKHYNPRSETDDRMSNGAVTQEYLRDMASKMTKM